MQIPEARGQLLKLGSIRSQAPVNMPQATKAHSGFTETDAPSCSTSTSANSYPLQNGFAREKQCASLSEEKTACANLLRPSTGGPQSSMPTSNLVGESQVTSWYSSVKESNQATFQNYLNSQLGQIETSSSSAVSFPLAQADTSLPQSLSSLPLPSSPFFFRDVSQNSDIQTDPQRTMAPTFDTGKDIQTQLSAAISSQSFGVPDLPFDSGVSSDMGISDSDILQRGSWQQTAAPVRTYTKVYKLGSVGRSIDVTRCRNYDELRHELACMFKLVGQLEDPHSGWQLVFVDNENDVLLVGDDPWEEFVSCVRSIKILSPKEVLQMSQEGMEILNTLPLQQQACSSSDGGIMWRDHCDQNSTNPSIGSLEH